MENSSTQYRPERPVSPGASLKALLEERAMTQAQLAKRVERTRKQVNQLIKGDVPLTPDMATRLERALSTPSAEFWLRREASYRTTIARLESEAELKADVGWLKEIPVQFMMNEGWIPRAGSKAGQVWEALRFFNVQSVESWRTSPAAECAFRASTKAESSRGAVAAWLQEGERRGRAMSAERFDDKRFKSALHECRALTREPDPARFLPALEAACARAGVAVVVVRRPPKCPVSGATRWLGPARALIQLSLRYKTNDHLWFTFFHEAGHVLLHGKRIFLEHSERASSKQEKEADAFAQDILIPRVHLSELKRLARTKSSVSAFAKKIGVGEGIVVGRLQHDKALPHTHLNELKVTYDWA